MIQKQIDKDRFDLITLDGQGKIKKSAALERLEMAAFNRALDSVERELTIYTETTDIYAILNKLRLS